MDSADCLPVVRFGCEADTPRPPVVYRSGRQWFLSPTVTVNAHRRRSPMATKRTRVRRRSKPPFDVKRLRRRAIRPPTHDVRPDEFTERKTVLALPADADGPPSVKTRLTKRGRGAAARWEVELVVGGCELHPVPPPPLQTRLIPTRQLARVAIDAMPASMPAT